MPSVTTATTTRGKTEKYPPHGVVITVLGTLLLTAALATVTVALICETVVAQSSQWRCILPAVVDSHTYDHLISRGEFTMIATATCIHRWPHEDGSRIATHTEYLSLRWVRLGAVKCGACRYQRCSDGRHVSRQPVGIALWHPPRKSMPGCSWRT